VQPTPDGRAALLLGEVRGHDVDAAVTAGQVRQTVRVLRRLDPTPARVLDLLNTILLETVPADGGPRFVSAVVGTAQALDGGGVRLHLAAGGHLPPLVVRHDGVQTVELGGGGVVGARVPPRLGTRTVELAPGEACVLYTGGVVNGRDGFDGQLFGERRLAELLAGCHVLPAPGIVERVLEHATGWCAESGHDDMAVLVVQAPPASGALPARRHLYLVPTDAPGEERPAHGPDGRR
jgi:serine phosphatase RsbU (regulator of sigma subunit)